MSDNRINLSEMAREITLKEGLEQRQSIAQVREILGIIGDRWRNMSDEEFLQEANCIRKRAGINSAHRESE